jgi:hypothetical protein
MSIQKIKNEIANPSLGIKLFVFFLGLSYGQTLPIFGAVLVWEIVAVLLFPVTFSHVWKTVKFNRILWFATFILVTFPGIIILMDTLNGIPLFFSLRQAIKIYFIIAIVCLVYYIFQKHIHSLTYLLIGQAIGSFSGLVMNNNEGAIIPLSDYYVDTYVYGPIFFNLALLCMFLVGKINLKLAGLVGFIFLVAGAVFFTFPRNSYLVLFIVIFTVLLVSVFPHLRKIYSGGIFKRWLQGVFLMALGTSLVYVAYVKLAPAGYLGQFHQERFFAQTQGRFGASPLGLLLTGRFDVLIHIHAIMDKPLRGHGSHADLTNYIIPAAETASVSPSQLGTRYDPHTNERLTEHSAILTGWTYYGIFGIPFWVVILISCVSCFALGISYLKQKSSFGIYFVYISTSGLWALFFSPILTTGRLRFGILIGAGLLMSQIMRNRRNSRLLTRR